jgi:ABC-2 type transporter
MIGILAGTLFWQAQDANSIIAILFQSMFYACVAQMGAITRQFPDRSIYYKQQDANFFPTWSYVLGRSIASIPIAVIDAIGYGTVRLTITYLNYNLSLLLPPPRLTYSTRFFHCRSFTFL